MTYPISDMIIRIKNAYKAGKESVNLPYSGIKENICMILKREGFIDDYAINNIKDSVFKNIEIKLSYFENKKPTIIDIKATSTPGLRFYKRALDIKPYKNGLGMEVFSTSAGILSDVECREKNIGGLSLLKVF
ncbi:MAG: 30S ribosomal protein S8 [Deltaproteobacteria bacterium]|jgi:small subunit ribosomal protein S8|nr:30S ribosomal protein S8 [Deltaproteobacteria bacterium]MCL5879326.1 30S ribosomal protein S8 [Deltaproteobacteria bacterium]MDA8304588.1 30S ribosomal protein S8 [Deltaproteobacteria bacterium]